jgi:hypothetical protein
MAACAPHVTIADGTSGAGGDGGSATGGATGGTRSGTTSTGGTRGGTTSTGGASSNVVCYVSGGFGTIAIPCGGSANGGSEPQAGSTGFAGSAGGFEIPQSCAQPFDRFAPSSCYAPGELRLYCAKGGCHNPATRAADLDLTPDDFLVARILNVRATFDLYPDCTPLGCPTEALLVDQASPSSCWMLRQMDPFVPGVTTGNDDMGCGIVMPNYNTTGTSGYGPLSKACLIELFTNIALDGTPCFVLTQRTPNRPPPCDDGGAAGD